MSKDIWKDFTPDASRISTCPRIIRFADEDERRWFRSLLELSDISTEKITQMEHDRLPSISLKSISEPEFWKLMKTFWQASQKAKELYNGLDNEFFKQWFYRMGSAVLDLKSYKFRCGEYKTYLNNFEKIYSVFENQCGDAGSTKPLPNH